MDGRSLTFLAAALFVATLFLRISFIFASTFVADASLAALFFAGAAALPQPLQTLDKLQIFDRNMLREGELAAYHRWSHLPPNVIGCTTVTAVAFWVLPPQKVLEYHIERWTRSLATRKLQFLDC